MIQQNVTPRVIEQPSQCKDDDEHFVDFAEEWDGFREEFYGKDDVRNGAADQQLVEAGDAWICQQSVKKPKKVWELADGIKYGMRVAGVRANARIWTIGSARAAGAVGSAWGGWGRCVVGMRQW